MYTIYSYYSSVLSFTMSRYFLYYLFRFDSRSRREKFRCPNTLSLVSFAGMTLDKCIVLRIGTLTGCPLCRESHPLCRLKNPTVISIWLLVGFHPATRSVQSTPADNTRKRVWQYIEKESVPISSQNLQNLVSGQPSGKSFGSVKDSNSSVNDSPMSLKS